MEVSSVTAIIDSGASINIMAERQYQALAHKKVLQKAKVRVFTYGQTQLLKMAGMFETIIAHGDTQVPSKVYVAKDGHRMLLSGRTAEALRLINFMLSVPTTGLEAIL